MKRRLPLAIFLLGLMLSSIIGQPPAHGTSPLMLKHAAQKSSGQDQDAKDASLQNPQEAESQVAALTDKEARALLLTKLKEEAAQNSRSVGDEQSSSTIGSGGISAWFHKMDASSKLVLSNIGNLFTSQTVDVNKWQILLNRLTDGQGVSHLMITLLGAAAIILFGVIMEYLIRRSTQGLRGQVVDAAPLAKFKKAGLVFSYIFLELVALAAFLISTFIVFSLVYESWQIRHVIVSAVIVTAYYLRIILFACKVTLSPSTAAARLLPLADQDAKFLYRWIIRISLVAAVITAPAFILRNLGASEHFFLLIYSTTGLAISAMLVWMILQMRSRVAEAICSDSDEGECKTAGLRNWISGNWHYFAIAYVIVTGIIWEANVMLEGRGKVINLIISLFVIPVFIALDQWVQRLLMVASGELPEIIDLSGETKPDDEATDQEASGLAESELKKDFTYYVPMIKRAFRIFLFIFMMLVMLNLWDIDLPIGRIFTSHVLSILVTLLVGFAGWQFAKARIDRKIREEMPDSDEEMDEGGAGGSRAGTLLLLLRKFILVVLIVIIGMIVLSSIGVNIGPLIAGAGVIGLAIGFGAQTLVKDIISGIFFLIDDAFRVGDYIQTSGQKGLVEHISIRSLRLRHHRGMVHTIPFGDMGTVTNFTRDYIITKLDVRVRYDADVEKIRKIIKKINKELSKHEEIGKVLLSKIKSQGVREMDDSAMILRVKFKTIPGEQFVVRREVYRLIQESFRENGIEFAHRNVTVYLPPEVSQAVPNGDSRKKLLEAAGAAGAAAAQAADEAAQEKESK